MLKKIGKPKQRGVMLVLSPSFVYSISIDWLDHTLKHWIMGLMKEGGAKGNGKVSSLLLAAFAIMMIRIGMKGWMGLIYEWP
jgi:small neutral amino acid transporter SnatA (MarC family)